MKWIKKEYVWILEWGFKLSYLLLVLVSFNSFLYDSPLQPLLVKICMLFGLVTVLMRLCFLKDYIETPYWQLLLLFCGSFLFSMIMNRQYGAFIEDFKWLLWTGFLFFLLYVCDNRKTIRDYQKEFTVFSHVMIIYSVAAALVSIGFLLIKYQVKWYTADGEQMLAGFHWGRLWGVYTDPNYGGVFAAAAIVLCIYYVRKKQGLKKLFYAAAAVLNLLYLIFTDSRTAALAVCVSISFWAVYLAVSKKEKKRLFLTIVACVLLSGVFILGSSFVKKEYMKFADIKIGREEDLEGNISNGRLELWQSGLEVFKTRPLYGTGYNSFLPYTEECLPDTAAVNNPQKAKYVSLHNEFVNILVYQGIIGIAIFTTFAVCIFVYWLKSAKKFAGEDQDYMAVLAACILVTVVSMVFLLDGLHTNSPGSFMLWTFAGYSMHYCRKMRKAEKQR